MRYLSNNPAYLRQTSGLGNRDLPSIPEGHQRTFLAADGSEHPAFELEPISPSTDSTQSFDLPACTATITVLPDDSVVPDGAKSDADGAPIERPPPPPTLDHADNMTPILGPHIIINSSGMPRSQHGTPASSPSSSIRSNRSAYDAVQLPLTRPNRSASSPAPYYLYPSDDYDRLDRSRTRSLASGTSSAGESANESRQQHQRRRRRSNTSRSSLNKKRHSIDRLATVSRTDESDTELDDSAPMLPDRNPPDVPTKYPLPSSESISSEDPMLELNHDNQEPKVDPRANSGYISVPSFPGFARSSSPSRKSRSPQQHLSTDPVTEDPYMVTNLADWQPTPGESYHSNENIVEIASGAASSGTEAKEYASKPASSGYEAPVSPIYAKPHIKSELKNAGSDDNKQTDFADENQTEVSKIKPEVNTNQPEADENVATVNENAQGSDETPSPKNHDYFVLNIPKRSTPSDASDQDEYTVAPLPPITTDGNFRSPAGDRNDYETPIGDIPSPASEASCQGNAISGETTPQQTRDGAQTLIASAAADRRVDRVDDYETPMLELMKPSATD